MWFQMIENFEVFPGKKKRKWQNGDSLYVSDNEV